MKKKLRIAWAGGGTGGHTFPIQSLLQYFGSHPDYAQQVEAHYWFGKEQSLEQAVYLKLQTEIQNLIFFPLLSGKWRREKTISALLRNFWDLVLFTVGVFQALWYLWKYQIDVIFCKGGYVALPVVVAGWILRKKIIVHESDTHPGLVNRIAGKVATQNFS